MIKKLISIVALTILASACSEVVPPAHKGKVLARSGFTPEVYNPGRVGGFYLWSAKKMILLDTSTKAVKETINVKLADDIELAVDVRTRLRVGGSDAIINAMFNDVALTGNLVEFATVYGTYGRMTVRNTVRRVVSKYKVKELSKNYSRISEEIRAALVIALADVPLVMSDASLGNIAWPPALTKAINDAMVSDAQILKIEKDRVKDIAHAEAREAIALAIRKADLVEAETLRLYQLKIAAGLSPDYLKYKAILVQEKMVEAIIANPTGTTIFMPYEALQTTGANVKMFK